MARYSVLQKPEDYKHLVPSGEVTGHTSVNKFGRNTNCDSGVATDIWDLSTQAIWLAPTQARTHSVVSSEVTDATAPGGTGGRKVRVYGLTDWDTAETYEDITMLGTDAQTTVNDYVCIHRMKVIESGSLTVNDGTIKATAATDNTITAQINPLEGQTQMAIYAIPSTRAAYMTQFYVSVLRASNKATAMNMSLLWTPNGSGMSLPGRQKIFQVKHTIGLYDAGVGTHVHPFNPYNRFDGPGILKLQVTTDQDDSDVSAGFDLILEDIS